MDIGGIRVFVAEYLEQPNIQLELSDGTLRPAVYHRWAQALELESERYLERLLEPKGDARAPQIEIMIQRFHGDELGEVLLEGKWKSSIPGEGGSEDWRYFEFRESSKEPGYTALVDTHAALLTRLGSTIVENL